MKCKQCGIGIKPMFKFCSDSCETVFFNNTSFECSIDGNCLSIVAKGFKNLQEDNSVFLGLTPKQIEEIKDLIIHPKRR